MNIFFCDQDPVKAAQALPDKLVVKMVTESVQMLSTCHALAGAPVDGAMKPTHGAHPCNQWLLESSANYEWLLAHTHALAQEYSFRYESKTHGSAKYLPLLQNPPASIPVSAKMTRPKQAISEKWYRRNCAVEAYRVYLSLAKDYAAWKKGRPMPQWCAKIRKQDFFVIPAYHTVQYHNHKTPIDFYESKTNIHIPIAESRILTNAEMALITFGDLKILAHNAFVARRSEYTPLNPFPEED